MAWCFHYFPFFLMGRQLFLHHYLPALYFAILLLCVTFDLGCRFIPNRYRFAALVVVSLTAIYVFNTRSSLVYGSKWTRSQCESSKLLSTWDYDCYHFPETYAEYASSSSNVMKDANVGRIVDPVVPEEDKKPHDFVEQLFPRAPSSSSAVRDDKASPDIAAGESPSYTKVEEASAAGNHTMPTVTVEVEKENTTVDLPPVEGHRAINNDDDL